MIYTLGSRRSYLHAFGTPPVTKIGRTANYPGGYAFKTIADARRHKEEAHPHTDFIVFGLLADWETDTHETAGQWWRNLTFDRQCVMIQDVTD